MDLRIRRGGPELIDELEPLWLALHAHHQKVAPQWRYHGDPESWRIRSERYREWLAEPDAFVLVASIGEQLAGYALVHFKSGPDDSWVTGERMAELETISVTPGHRGQGIGTALMDAVDAELDRLGISDLFIGALAGNEDAQRFYASRGFRPITVHLARLGASPC
jgi:GNAT superfamily N-acetyltransferase